MQEYQYPDDNKIDIKFHFNFKIFIIIFSVIIALIAGYFVYHEIDYRRNRIELKITFITSQKHNSKDLSCNGLLNQWEWGILTDEEQRKNWEMEGYVIPKINFKNNFLIMSRYKIKKLYQKPGCDECLGVPEGEAIFNKYDSNNDFYYFYLMPRIWLSQGVG